MIWLGMAGATGQLTTDYAWNMFTLVILFRINNANIARLLYESFHTDRADSDEVDQFKVKNAALTMPEHKTRVRDGVVYESVDGAGEEFLDLKVLALALQLANVLFFTALLLVVFNPQQLTAVTGTPFWLFVILGFVIPEGLRFGVHLKCQVQYSTHHGMFLLLSYQFLFLWDLCIRVIAFSAIVWWADLETFFGSRGFMHREFAYVMTQAVGYFATY